MVDNTRYIKSRQEASASVAQTYRFAAFEEVASGTVSANGIVLGLEVQAMATALLGLWARN